MCLQVSFQISFFLECFSTFATVECRIKLARFVLFHMAIILFLHLKDPGTMFTVDALELLDVVSLPVSLKLVLSVANILTPITDKIILTLIMNLNMIKKLRLIDKLMMTLKTSELLLWMFLFDMFSEENEFC